MADDRQPEDGSAQWDPSRGQEPIGTHGANGFSSSSYRTCQTGGAHTTAAPFSARENGFNGELTGAHAVTAEQVSARIVQEVTAEAVAVLKGEQESQRLPSGLPHTLTNTCTEEETMEALTAEYEEEVEEEDDVDEEEDEEESAEAALDEQQWSGEEPDPDIPEAEVLEQAEAVDKAPDLDQGPVEAASAPAGSSLDREEEQEEEEEEEAEGEESPETGVSSPSAHPACMLTACPLYTNAGCV
uniref:Microtubule-associated protein 2 n=1 Tax=Hippocampus comes TaxID=109280 RepID=A0A3Q2Y1L8_HIPCM